MQDVMGLTTLRQGRLNASSVSRKSFAVRIKSIRTHNRHRWTGRADQGEREKLV